MARRKKIPLTQDDVATIMRLAGIGLNRDKIAAYFGMCKRTLERRVKDTPELNIDVALAQGKAIAEERVTTTAYDMASSGKSPSMTRYWLNCRAGWRATETIEVSGPNGNPISTSTETAEQREDRLALAAEECEQLKLLLGQS